MHEHGFVPSDFPAFRRDSGTTVLDVNEALAADANFGFAPTLALAKQTAATIAIALRFCGAFGSLMSASSETVGRVL